MRNDQKRRFRGCSAAGALVAIAMSLTGCSSDSDKPATTADDSQQTSTKRPDHTRHAVVIGLDGLTAATLGEPKADLLAQIRDRSVSGATSADPPSADGTCSDGWTAMLHEGKSATGANGLDAIGDVLDTAELGAFAADPALGPVITPTNTKAVSKTAAVDVPGLQAWPRTLLEVEQVRDAAIKQIGKATTPSVTVIQADLLTSQPPEPGLAVDAADDLVDFVLQSIDGRLHRADEDWMVVIAGVCAQTGTPTLLVYGDGISSPGSAAIDPSMTTSLLSSYLGVTPAGTWTKLPNGILADSKVKNGKVSS